MKKLLIIQLDEPYFLFETLQVLERNQGALKDFEVTVLAAEESVKQFQDGSAPLSHHVTTNQKEVLEKEFDLSFNLSLAEAGWVLHSKIKSPQKTGPTLQQDQISISDVWSSYLFTLKARSPFLAFHLQDVYKNILGFKKIEAPHKRKTLIKKIAIGACKTAIFSPEDQEELIQSINETYPHIALVDISEIDVITDLSHILYIGPATFEALKICENGARGVFLSTQFQGFNLLPCHEGHYYISSRNQKFTAEKLFSFVSQQVKNQVSFDTPYSVYSIETDNLFGSYLKSLNHSDDAYPFYQAHVVLWNFVLNLFDTNLDVTMCTPSQVTLLKQYQSVIGKLIRLYDYAMSSIDSVHSEAKSQQANYDKIQGHLKNLKDIEGISDKISQSHAFLRPVLDYYRIRRGQNFGTTLLEQAQHTFLAYSEEHSALKALDELFSVTLQRNEVNI